MPLFWGSQSSRAPGFVREQGHIEAYQTAVHLAGFYPGIAITCRYAVPQALRRSDEIQSLQADLKHAVARVALRYPLMQVGIGGEQSGKPYWLRFEHLNLDDHIDWTTVDGSQDYDNVLRELLERQYSTKFESLDTRPPWKLNILRSDGQNHFDVVFAWHHANGDGTAGKIFHQALLEFLNSAPRGDAPPELKGDLLTIPRSKDFTPSQEQMVDLPISPTFLLSSAWENLRPPLLQGPTPPTAASWAPKQALPNTTRVRVVNLPDEPLQRVLAACRTHKATLTSLVHALTLVSLAGQLSPERAQAFVSDTPFDLRRFIDAARAKGEEPEGIFACLISMMPHKHSTELVSTIRKQLQDQKGKPATSGGLEDTIWSVAARVRQEIVEKLNRGMKNDLMGMLKFVGDWKSYLNAEMQKPRSSSWVVSSLGVMKSTLPGHDDGWTIESCIFGQCCIVHGPAITIDAMAVEGKSLSIAITWQADVVDNEIVESLSTDLNNWLRDMGESGSVTIR